MNSTLTRSSDDKILGGVCGGIARTTGIDTGLLRLITIAIVLFTGIGPFAYLIAWAVLPSDDGTMHAKKFVEQVDGALKDRRQGSAGGTGDTGGWDGPQNSQNDFR